MTKHKAPPSIGSEALAKEAEERIKGLKLRHRVHEGSIREARVDATNAALDRAIAALESTHGSTVEQVIQDVRTFPIVTLVGSVKQEVDWRRYTAVLTAKGYIVLEAGVYGTLGDEIPKETWDLVTRIHWAKIEMSDLVAVIPKPDLSIGEHTEIDIRYALKRGIRVANVLKILDEAKSTATDSETTQNDPEGREGSKAMVAKPTTTPSPSSEEASR